MLIIIISISFVICLCNLFNHNPNLEWLEIFKCLDGSLTPKSVGIKDKRIMLHILVLTKIGFKLLKISIIIATPIAIILFINLFYQNGNPNSQFELIAFIIWFPPALFITFFNAASLSVACLCFQIMTYYCFITARHFNQLIKDVKI